MRQVENEIGDPSPTQKTNGSVTANAEKNGVSFSNVLRVSKI